MQELSPLTISNSVRKNPTVLFTKTREKYLLNVPVNETNHADSELYCFIYHHFKIATFNKGIFSFQGKKYLCSEEIDGSILLHEWLSFQWESKRSFSRFIRTKSLFDMFLVDLFFPLFKPSEKWIVPGVKDQFRIHPFPVLRDNGFFFEAKNISAVGLNDPSIKSFFRYMKSDLMMFLEEFTELHHEKFKVDLKYRISLYSELRNQYWGAVQQCFDPAFINYSKAEVENYILQL
jgi:hypothetical protein